MRDTDWSDPYGFLELEPSGFRLYDFELVSATPLRDALGLTGTKVTAPSLEEAWTYLIDRAGWSADDTRKARLRAEYRLHRLGEAELSGKLTEPEWIHCVLLGYAADPVRWIANTTAVEQTGGKAN